MKPQIFLKLSLIAFAISLTACGASKSGSPGVSSNDYASRNHPGNNGSGEGVSDGPLAECNFIPQNSADIEGRLTTFYHPTSGEFYPEYIRMQLTRVPVEITSTSSHYIQIFRWHADDSGQRQFNSTPVGFYFYRKSTKQYMNTEPINVISKATLQNIITDNGLGSQGVTMTNFFDKFVIVMEGMDLTYDAVLFALYDQNQGSSAYASVDALLPAFSANPNTYAANHTAGILQQLHPFWSSRNTNYSDEQYRAASMEYCIPQ